MACRSCIEKHYRHRTILSYLLLPATGLFSLILILRRWAYGKLLSQYRAPVFIISVGNMIVGGSGKTPFTIFLAEQLQNKGIKVAVSHRGYKSELEKQVTLISDREKLLPAADKAGDEAWLIASRLHSIPVAAGRDRKAAIQMLCRTYPDLDCIILDDSFQHLKVRHDYDIIIVSEWLRFGNGFVLPSGILREPLDAIKKADLIVLNRITETGTPDKKLIEQFQAWRKETITGGYRADRLYDFCAREVDPGRVKQDAMLMVAGVGNPSGFEVSCRFLGLKIIGGMPFPDHYDYSNETSRQNILKLREKTGAKWIVTTEKDYAKLRKYEEFAGCLLVLGISFEPAEHTDHISDLIISKLHSRNQKS
jgi:tetraacyldisaccharide 4'-kinase